MGTATPYLYDQVKLTDSTQGVVKYIGEIKGKNGTFFGLEMLPYYGGHDNADTNGTIGDQQYFTTTDNETIGRFVSEDDIDDVIDEPTHSLKLIGESPKFTVGDRCFIDKKNCNAMVHFVGIPKFAKNPKIFIGLELDEPNGNTNGTLLGCTYFSCEDKYGLYQVPKNVSLAQEEVTIDIDEVDEQNYDQPIDNEQDDEDEKENEIETEPEVKPKYIAPKIEKKPEPIIQSKPIASKKIEAAPKKVEKVNIAPKIEPEKVKDDAPKAVYKAPVQKPKKVEVVKKVEPVPKAEPKKVYKAPVKALPVSNEQKEESVYDIGSAPTLAPRKVVDANGTETIYPTYMTNFCVKARTHHKLKNYKTINYSSKKFQVHDVEIQKKMDDLAKEWVSDRGNFVVDGDKKFAYILVKEPHEWRAAVRINTDNADDAMKVLLYIHGNTQQAVSGVDRIQKFNWDKNFQSLVSAVRKANM